MVTLKTSEPTDQVDSRRRIPLKRRLIYASVIYLCFLLLLTAIEIGTRLTLPHVSSLDLFVITSQQKAQVADATPQASLKAIRCCFGD